MREPGQDHVLELLRLLRDSGRNPGMCVSMKVHPPGRYGVHDAPAILENQVGAFPPSHRQRRRIECGLRKRMPDPQRGHFENALRSKKLMNTCSSAVRWRLGRRGISPI